MMTGPARLRRFRLARRLTRKQLATSLEVHPSMIGQLERGERGPGLALACAIARVTDTWAEGAITPFEWVEAKAAS